MIFVTDIPVSGIYGLNPSLFIVFMHLYECLMINLLSIATPKFKWAVQRLFLLHRDRNILYNW